MNKDLGIIIVAGGSGTRFGKQNKLLQYIPCSIHLPKFHTKHLPQESSLIAHNKNCSAYSECPVFICSLLNFYRLCPDHQIVLVCHSDLIDEYKKLTDNFIPENEFIFTTGGVERYNSVINGLDVLPDNVKYVAVHDAARPLANKKLLNKCLDSCKQRGSGIAAKKINDTVKRTSNDKKVIENIDRTNLWAIETPQIFRIQDLKSAYEKLIQSNATITDDAGAMELAGFSVFLVESPELNIKITNQSDIEYIKTFL